jgi:hypothetical protein
MNEHTILISQYRRAALEMLKQTIIRCPDSLWNNLDAGAPIWQIAYHALFYTHLYVQDSQQTFTAWSKHRKEYLFGDELPQPPHQSPEKAIVLEDLAFCDQQVLEKVTKTNLEADSGFDWLPFRKLELHLYTIRHIQQHVGELMERLGSRAAIEVDWIGSRHE